MLETIVVILVLMWALGMGVGYTLGGLIHVLLVVALITVIFRIIQGKKIIN